MKVSLKPSPLKGNIYVPPSKSHTLRAILFATMGKGRSFIENTLPSPDTEAMITACRAFGAHIEKKGNSLWIEGINHKVQHKETLIDAGNSGQVLRFAGALASLSHMPFHFTGDHSIQHNRPVQPLLEGLNQLGVKAFSTHKHGYAPFIVKGRLQPGHATIDGADSQPVSGLLIAAAFCEGPIELNVIHAGEKPWVGLTLSWFDRLGIYYEEKNREWFHMKGNSSYDGFNYSVPGDFSSAAFHLVAALITQSTLVIENVDMTDAQGDKAVVNLLKERGAAIDIDAERKRCVVNTGGTFKGGVIDVNDFIDAVPILSVLGCFGEEKTVLINAAIARKKECDRLSSITHFLRLMGATIEEEVDQLTIYPSKLRGSSNLKSCKDHRMAMSLSVAALGAQGESIIDDCSCVAKSYPSFFQDLQQLGAQVKIS